MASLSTIEKGRLRVAFAATIPALFLSIAVFAQEILPKPLPPFQGQIGQRAQDSKPAFPPSRLHRRVRQMSY
jgi:hypothetical protein